jgi:hypothetical protein
VSERERPPDSDEIDFDFFDDAPTREAPSAEAEPAKRRPRVPTRPPSGPGGSGRQSILRLIVMIGAAILIAVVLVLWVNSCREDKKRDQYTSYMDDVSKVALDSEQIGKDLTKLITTPGITLTDLQSGLEGLRGQQAQVVAQADNLNPPGPLRDQQQSLVEALQFRVSGLGGLAEAFGTIDETTDPTVAGRQLQEQSARLLASDVVYEDLFKAGSQDVLKQEAISGVAVPDSNFITQDNSELLSGKSWALIVQRVAQGGGQATGLRGTALQAVIVQPSGKKLSPDQENTVTASDQLAFEVRVKNSGDVQLTQVPVQLTLQLSPEPVQKTATIDLIDPGDTKSVVFRQIDVAGSFGTLVTLKVSVEPVDGEENTSNNSAEYSVIFTLG